MNDLIQEGTTVDMGVLPFDLQPTEDEVQQSLVEVGGEPEMVVPTNQDIINTEAAMERVLSDIRRVGAFRNAITGSGSQLSNSSVAVLQSCMESVHGNVAFARADAFRTGAKGAGAYAIERLDQLNGELLQRLLKFFMHWARQVFLWVEASFERREQAKRAIAEAKVALPKIKAISLTPSGFQGRGFLPAVVVNSMGIDEGVNAAPQAFVKLTDQMRAFLSAAGSMFTEVSTSASGKFDGVKSTGRLATFLKEKPTFNEAGVGGQVWVIRSKAELVHGGGDKIYSFDMETNAIPGDAVEAVINQGAFRAIVNATASAMTQCELVVKSLQGYAKGIPTYTKATEELENSEKIHSIESAMSLVSVLRESAVKYDRIICRAGQDVGRAIRYTV